MMKINFFEEFPEKEVLKKASLIKFNSIIYIAAQSLKKFDLYSKQIKKINKRITPAYWPILKKEEGYWLSPFSETKALERVFNELKKHKKKLTVLLDLELPTHTPKLFFKNFFRFFRNKRMIKDFVMNKPENLTLATAEYSINNGLLSFILRFLGIRLKKVDERIFMCYTSTARNDYWEKVMRKNIKKQKSVGLGVIATGILGNELLLSSDKLGRDLELAQKSKTKTVTIFRLGGLNKEYLEVINKFKSS